MTLIKHLPALQVLIPFFAALFSALAFQRVIIARIIATLSIIANCLLSLYGLVNIEQKNSRSYNFGDWQAPIGIEYRLDYFNQPLILYINFVLLFVLVFCYRLINTTVLKSISAKRQSLFFTILLFAHSGYIGMLSTNDLFNLYVFIEISSLSSYVLIAQGNNLKAFVGAFDYLMLGTIGATLILLAIGFLFSVTGSLNMTDIAQRLTGQYNSKIVMTGISFFLIGATLKTAFFPMHFWMIRAYEGCKPVILIYLTVGATIVGIYTIFRFIHFTIDFHVIADNFISFIRPLALLTISLCSYLAWKTSKVKAIIIYAASVQIGYVFLLLATKADYSLLFLLLFADSLNKIFLFTALAFHEEGGVNNIVWRCLVVLGLICSAGLPLSSLFIVKLNILDSFIKNNLWVDIIIILISSSVSLLYYYNITKKLFLPTNYSTNSYICVVTTSYFRKYFALVFIILTQILLFVSLGKIQVFYVN